MRYTDENIPIECAECQDIVEGVKNMIQHILELHKDYSPNEAITYAMNWGDGAYNREAEREIKATEYKLGRTYQRREP